MQTTGNSFTGSKIELPDGKMHYQSLGKGLPILLLHSVASSVWSWSKVIDPLSGKYTVYALDTMGQGDSDKPRSYYTIRDYAKSVINFMEAKGISNATLIGNSVGAVFAVAVTAIKRTMVDKLILVGCPCWETKRERENAKAIVKANYDDHGIPLAYSLEKLKQSYTKVSPELLAKVNEDRRKAGIWAWKCLDALTQFDIVPALRRVRARTLLIYGEQDKLRDKENALHNYIMNSTLAIVPDAGHLPQLDNPHAFLEVVQPFLESSG